MKTTSRPPGVIVLTVLLVLSGAAALFAALPHRSQGVPPAALVLDVVVGGALFALAWGMYNLEPWAWVSTVVVQLINAFFAIITIASAPRVLALWIPLVVAAIALALLTRRDVRAAFAEARARV